MDRSPRSSIRRAHTKHSGYCTCGKIVSGNGGIYNHSKMHKRKGDGHNFMTYSAWQEKQAITQKTSANTLNGTRHSP